MQGTLVAGRLSDGRLQFWLYCEGGQAGKLYTFSQTSTDLQADWLSQGNWSDHLTEFPMPPDVTGGDAYGATFSMPPDATFGLAVGTLPDGRLELCLAGGVGIWTCVMLTNDAGSKWSAWAPLYDPLVPIDFFPSLRQVPPYQSGQVPSQVPSQGNIMGHLPPILPPPLKP